MAEIADRRRIEFLQSLPQVMTWVAYGPRHSWSGKYRSFRGVDIDFSRGLMPFFRKYQTHLMGADLAFLTSTNASYSEFEIRSAIDAAMEKEISTAP